MSGYTISAMSFPLTPEVTRILRVVILYRTQACRAQAAAAGMMPTTVRIDTVGTMVSVMAGGPS